MHSRVCVDLPLFSPITISEVPHSLRAIELFYVSPRTFVIAHCVCYRARALKLCRKFSALYAWAVCARSDKWKISGHNHRGSLAVPLCRWLVIVRDVRVASKSPYGVALLCISLRSSQAESRRGVLRIWTVALYSSAWSLFFLSNINSFDFSFYQDQEKLTTIHFLIFYNPTELLDILKLIFILPLKNVSFSEVAISFFAKIHLPILSFLELNFLISFILDSTIMASILTSFCWAVRDFICVDIRWEWLGCKLRCTPHFIYTDVSASSFH